MNRTKFHLKQIYLTIKTRKHRGDMDLLTYHSFRIYKLWKYREADKYRPLNNQLTQNK